MHRIAAVWFVVAIVGIGQAPAGPIDLPVRLIDGGLYLRAELKASGEPYPVHLLLDLGETEALRLHRRTAALLELDGGAVRVQGPGFHFDNLVPVVDVYSYLENLTAAHAAKLEEIPVVGVLGPSALPRERRLELDLDRERVRLLPRPKETEPPAPPAPPTEATEPPPRIFERGERVQYEFLNGLPGLRLDAKLGRQILAASLDTTHGDTTVDWEYAKSVGLPDLAFDPASLEGIDLRAYSALRPRIEDRVAADAAVLLVGTRTLAHFIITIEFEPARVTFEALAKPDLASIDREIFSATGRGDAGEMERLLETNTEHRGAADLARRLFEQRLSETPLTGPPLEKALEFFAKSSPARLRTRLLLRILDNLKSGAPEALALVRKKGIALALEFAEKDEDPEALHRAQSELGMYLMEEGGEANLKEAYRHLLAAALATPRSGINNYRLGLLYEKLGKFERAWSRFLAAAIDAEAGPDGLAALARLAKERGLSGPSDIPAMERALAGRAPAFEPASRYESEGRKPGARCVLVELFTHSRPETAAASELAIEGLGSHFEDGPVALLNHHPGVGPLNPLSCGASSEILQLRAPESLPAVVLDGTVVIPAEGRVDQAAPVFRKLREAIEKRLAEPAGGELSVQATCDRAGRIQVDASFQSDVDQSAMLHLLLTQKAVLFPGRSKVVFHRFVVRHDLLDGGQSVRLGAEPRSHQAFVTVEAIEGALEDHLDEREEESQTTAPMRPTKLWREGLTVVAWLERGGSVLQAATAPVVLEGAK